MGQARLTILPTLLRERDSQHSQHLSEGLPLQQANLTAPQEVEKFIKKRKQPEQQPTAALGLLFTTQDWQPKVDLGKQLKFPAHISASITQ